jgi:LAO/AO transport system kinase
LPAHQEQAQGIITRCLPYSGNSVRIGITGVPGVGKSTFIESFGKYLTSHGHKLAVLTIDPSSERSKGSILGDKTRMEELSADPSAFIRPSPSGGSLGGVARKTRESIILCEAAGFDTVIIETVGVGQSETLVHSMVDFFLLLMLAGAGDELQGIKRGIMEMADGIAINKADGSNVQKAKLAKIEFESALHLFPPPPSGWFPRVLTCSAKSKTGIDEVWEMIIAYKTLTTENGYFRKKRKEQSRFRMYETIREQLDQHFFDNEDIKGDVLELEKDVLDNRLTAYAAAGKLLKKYFTHFRKK